MTTAAWPTRRRTKNAVRPVWQNEVPCGAEDPELFFPIGTGAEVLAQIQRAKAVCAACPVREQCLQWALDDRQDLGVIGGLSEKERRRIHKRKKRIAERKQKTAPAADLIVRDRLGEYEGWKVQGLPMAEIARQMGTNVQTLTMVEVALEGLAVAQGAEQQELAA